MHRPLQIVSSLLLMGLACVIGLADDTPAKPEAAPAAAKAGAKQAAKKKPAEPRKEEKKVKIPAGYEDAPEARAAPRARNLAATNAALRALAAANDVQVGDGFEQLLAVNVDAQVANLEKRYIPRFTPLLTAELSFINRACKLNLEQRKQINAVSDRCLKGAVRKYAMNQRGLGRVRVAGQVVIPDPTELLHQSLAKVLSETLRPEQQAVYDAELAKRRDYHKRVAIENVVAMIDERLILTLEQRRELTESLNKNWRPIWVQSRELLMNNTPNLPNIPNEFVVSVFNESQKQVWYTIPKQSFTTFGGFGLGRQAGVVDDFPLVEVEAGGEIHADLGTTIAN